MTEMKERKGRGEEEKPQRQFPKESDFKLAGDFQFPGSSRSVGRAPVLSAAGREGGGGGPSKGREQGWVTVLFVDNIVLSLVGVELISVGFFYI